MKKLKTYFIYGFAFSAIVSLILIAIESIKKGSILEGIQHYTILQFILFWIGGMFVGFIRNKLGRSNIVQNETSDHLK